MDNQNRQEDDYRWDPESAYAKSGSRRLVAFILAVIILGVAAIWVLQNQNQRQNLREVELKASMRFEDADRKMQEAGYKPLFKAEKHENHTTRFYEGQPLLGLVPVFTVLDYTDGIEGGYRIGHTFEDDKGSSAEKPGEVYLRLKKELTALLGEPETRTDVTGPYLVWPRKNSSQVTLLYMSDGIPMVYFLYYNPVSSL